MEGATRRCTDFGEWRFLLSESGFAGLAGGTGGEVLLSASQCFNLAIEKLIVVSTLAPVSFQSRNREAYPFKPNRAFRGIPRILVSIS